MIDIDTFEEKLLQLDYQDLLDLKDSLIKELKRQDEEESL